MPTGVRLTITRGAGPIDVQSDADSDPNVFLIAWPLRDYSQLYADGATIVVITHEREIAARFPRQLTILDGRIVDDNRRSSRP